ncbi:heterokaryon incompatibility, partial [Bisporella sp. PMI_857]
MRLLKLENDGQITLTKDLNNDGIPPYAILSHTWGDDDQEVTFKDIATNTEKQKAGYRKIRFCGQQALSDGLQYFWVDTCCIDKSNNTELSEVINSMFRWYQNATRCYVYLSDVSTDGLTQAALSPMRWQPAFRASRWFTRGWTLQELMAPASMEFFSSEGERLGDKTSLELQLHSITHIPISAFQGHLSEFSTLERMSWSEGRQTTRAEDGAYSLMGIFGVYIPLIYGEGKKNAFIRLRKKI